MGKSKGVPGVQNRHIYSRASYLYQAGNFLARQACRSRDDSAKQKSSSLESAEQAKREKEITAAKNMSRQTLADMRAVSLKVQIRQSPALKQTICKFCDTLQIEGETCRSVVENQSKGGRKPWADVLVMHCQTCGHVKRYPVSSRRQTRRPFRSQQIDKTDQNREERSQEDATPHISDVEGA